ncbi:MAG: D-glycerate dehydrogenase [Rickettsiales bacterium]|nr:D-glycerate dehydrogenase [Rickettsiales bacterium]
MNKKDLKKNIILLTRKLPENIEKKLQKKYTIVQNKSDKRYSYKDLKKKIQDVDILIPCITDTIDASIIKAGKKLKLIANFGNGVDNIDLITAKDRKVLVTNTPDVLTDDTADLVLTMILMIARKILLAQKKLKNGSWTGWGPNETIGERLKGKQLGIIGMGRIGIAVAKRMKMLGMEINYHNRKRARKKIEKEFEAKYWNNLNEMLACSDVISIHCPFTPETFHLLSKKRLKFIKKSCIIINTSRGEIIDEEALANVLYDKKVGGAGLDVFEHEPQVTMKLLECENVVLLPHISSATRESRIAMGERVIRNIESFVQGKLPPDSIKFSVYKH